MDDQTPPPSRRGFLIGSGVAVIVAAGAGVAVGSALATDPPAAPTPRARQASKELTAAATAERALLATVDGAVTSATGRTRRVLEAIRADHVAHLTAIEAAISAAIGPVTGPSASRTVATTPPPVPAARAADVRAAESRASRAAATRALQLAGRDAALLASIAASEAGHAAVLA